MITRERISVSRAQDPAGGMVPYTNVAAYDWRTNMPDRVDGPTGKRWPIVADNGAGKPPSIVWYWDGAFRSSNGYAWTAPARWAYLRREEEVWNPDKQQWEIPGLTYTAPPATPTPMPEAKGEWLFDTMRIIAKHHKILDVRNIMDMVPWPNDVEGEPDTGAPEVMG